MKYYHLHLLQNDARFRCLGRWTNEYCVHMLCWIQEERLDITPHSPIQRAGGETD